MPSLPLLSIPLYYILAVVPYGYAVFGPGKPVLKNRDNANPNGDKNMANLKKTLSARNYATYQRALRCHTNSLENMPLFVAAIFAGLLAEKEAGAGAVGLDVYAIGMLVVRLGYTVNYLVTESGAWSNLRSALYNTGTFWSFTVIVRAAMKFA